MKLESSIYIHKLPNKVYETLKNIEEYGNFMLNVEHIKIIESKEDYRLSDWKLNISDTPITWQQEEYFYPDENKIRFKCIKGDISNFEGFWQVEDADGKSKLKFSLTIDWSGSLAIRFSNEFIHRKIEAITKAMLRAFKRKLDYGIEIVKGDTIISDLVQYKNRDGKNVVGYFDHLRVWSKEKPFIILPPGYGETKRDTLSTSYYLVKNGFNCLRYDATDHVGESDGEIVSTTLTKLKKDLHSALDYIELTFGVKKIGVVATSLAKRMAIKAATEDERIKFLAGVVGVVNLQETLKSIYKEDMVSAYLKGEKWGPTDILGLKVSFENFLDSAVHDKFHDLESTFKDVSKLKIPIVFLAAEKDVWVKADEVKLVFERTNNQEKEFHVIPDVMHQLQENPKVARIILKQLVVSCNKYMSNKTVNINEVLEPNIREIAMQNRIEKERLKLSEIFTLSSEKDFWSEYLVSFSVIYKVPDYRKYLTLLFELLNGLKDGDSILDAGCGVGYFGAWLINEVIKLHKINNKLTKKNHYYHYTGIDFVHSALETAKKQHAKILTTFAVENPEINNIISCEYKECDLNFDLPFEDNYFDKICCSLVLSYLTEPLLTLKELLRVLKPGGKIVISSLKPFTDLSEVYRHFVTMAKNEEEIVEARRLLSEAGTIKQKEGMGHYKFFNERELKFTFLASGAKKVKIYRSLGNQVNVAVATKE